MSLEAGHEGAVAVDVARDRPAPSIVAPRWFAALYALAVVAHVVGSPQSAPGLLGGVSLLLAAVAGGLIWRSSSRRLWVVAATLQLWTVWLEAPVLGNHWLLMGVFSIAVLLALTRVEPWPWLATAVGASFVTFYAFAAFAKLNTAFLEPSVSCAAFYADQGLRSWGLPGLPGSSLVATIPIVTALLIELSVPVLLTVRRTRPIGVALAAAFHFVISLDLVQHFFDFTAVIFVGLAVLATDDVTRPIGDWLRRRGRTVAVVVAAWALVVVSAVLPVSIVTLILTRVLVFVLWVPLAGAVVWLAIRGTRGTPASSLRRPDALALCLVALVALNGMTPYIGLKTAFGWNMYANLATTDGRANHLVVPAIPPVVDAEYVRVTAAGDETLQTYVGAAWAVPERNLRDHLARHPDTTVTFERADGTVVSGSGAQLGRAIPEVVRRLLPLRSVDLSEHAQCQALWLPAL